MMPLRILTREILPGKNGQDFLYNEYVRKIVPKTKNRPRSGDDSFAGVSKEGRPQAD